METIKRDLLVFLKKVGEASATAVQEEVVEVFLRQLQEYLTEKTLITMEPAVIRIALVHWMHYARTHGMDAAGLRIPQQISLTCEPHRTLRHHIADGNVVSLH